MVMAGSTAMMVGMGGEMGMDGVGVGLGAGAPQQGQGGLIPDQMGAVVEASVRRVVWECAWVCQSMASRYVLIRPVPYH